jgi:hypothetical protein
MPEVTPRAFDENGGMDLLGWGGMMSKGAISQNAAAVSSRIHRDCSSMRCSRVHPARRRGHGAQVSVCIQVDKDEKPSVWLAQLIDSRR